jgi:hypothetical protein
MSAIFGSGSPTATGARSMAVTPYKMTPVADGEFLVEIAEDGETSISGPFESAAAARAYIEEHSRLARAGKPRGRKKVGDRGKD